MHLYLTCLGPYFKKWFLAVFTIFLFCTFQVKSFDELNGGINILCRSGIYNITASEQPKFVWFRVAKVATRSIFYILRENNIPLSVNDSRIPFKSKKYKDHFKFAFVRNPWDRVVSCYFNKVVTESHSPFSRCFGKSFDYFVDFIKHKDLSDTDCHIKLQTALIPLEEVDFIGRLESFDEDFRYVADKLGLTVTRVPQKNSTSKRRDHYSKYYTERTKNIIAEKYKRDIEAFGYEFENVPD